MSRVGPPDEVLRALASFRSHMDARFGSRLRDLRLFGSFARGDFGPESDVDVLTVVENLTREERLEIFGTAADLYGEFRLRVSPLALSSAEYQTLRDREYRIATEIDRDGIAV